MSGFEDLDVVGFLSSLRLGTSKVYGRGLKLFKQFYADKGAVSDFLDFVERDRLLPRRKRRRLATEVLNGFVVWLSDRGYTPKTIRVYVGAVQSLAKYYDIPISLRYVRLPPAIGGGSSTSPPELVPTFSLKDINGTTQFSLSQQNGKVVAIHFMAVGCSGQIYPINDYQLRQLKTVCNIYCGKKPFFIVTVVVATCPNSQLANLRSNYNITWVLGNDYDDKILDIVNAYVAYSINDGTVILVDKNLRGAQVYREELLLSTVKSTIDELLEA
ncbi:hypothetical protein KEJ27_07415 [Candidatus Bathyarchaeota archaeon]|nr:hypothetical protein [Candidatus Bathyarchaeota archaeon]